MTTDCHQTVSIQSHGILHQNITYFRHNISVMDNGIIIMERPQQILNKQTSKARNNFSYR